MIKFVNCMPCFHGIGSYPGGFSTVLMNKSKQIEYFVVTLNDHVVTKVWRKLLVFFSVHNVEPVISYYFDASSLIYFTFYFFVIRQNWIVCNIILLKCKRFGKSFSLFYWENWDNLHWKKCVCAFFWLMFKVRLFHITIIIGLIGKSKRIMCIQYGAYVIKIKCYRVSIVHKWIDTLENPFSVGISVCIKSTQCELSFIRTYIVQCFAHIQYSDCRWRKSAIK